MSAELQQRAKLFVKRPVPKGLDYVPGSMAERFIATYARDGSLKPDPDLAELLELCVMESNAVLDGLTGAAFDYLTESAAIVQAIAEEMA